VGTIQKSFLWRERNAVFLSHGAGRVGQRPRPPSRTRGERERGGAGSEYLLVPLMNEKGGEERKRSRNHTTGFVSTKNLLRVWPYLFEIAPRKKSGEQRAKNTSKKEKVP